MSLSSGILRCGRHAAQEARAMAGGARRAASCRDQIVAGPVSISPPDWICPLLAIEWWHAEVRGDLRRRATSHDISNVLSTAPHRFNSRKPNGDVDAHHWCEGFHAAMRPRLLAWRRCSTWATSVTACFCPSWCTVSMIRDTPARTGHDGPRDRGISAQRLHGYSSGRRSHRQYWMPTRYARAG